MLAGQAQKEAWVNEAFARIDGLLHCSVEGERADPPPSPANGEAWVIATGATGAWAGKDAMIAARQADNWLYIEGKDGMRLYDKSTGQERLFATTWVTPVIPMEPTGGSVVDVEARAVLAELILALRVSGVFPRP